MSFYICLCSILAAEQQKERFATSTTAFTHFLGNCALERKPPTRVEYKYFSIFGAHHFTTLQHHIKHTKRSRDSLSYWRQISFESSFLNKHTATIRVNRTLCLVSLEALLEEVFRHSSRYGMLQYIHDFVPPSPTDIFQSWRGNYRTSRRWKWSIESIAQGIGGFVSASCFKSGRCTSSHDWAIESWVSFSQVFRRVRGLKN